MLKRLLLLVLMTVTVWAKPTILFCKVTKVYDGDTIKIDCVLGIVSVRLRNIDAPELRQTGGISSRDHLRSICPAGTQVYVYSYGRDRYGRILGDVYLAGDSVDLSRQQVSVGHAWVYRSYCKDVTWYRLEDRARQQHLGLWTSVPTPPWEFRSK